MTTCAPVFGGPDGLQVVKTRLGLSISHRSKVSMKVFGHNLHCSPLAGMFVMATSSNNSRHACVNHVKTQTTSGLERCLVTCQCNDAPCVAVQFIFTKQNGHEEVCEIVENY